MALVTNRYGQLTDYHVCLSAVVLPLEQGATWTGQFLLAALDNPRGTMRNWLVQVAPSPKREDNTEFKPDPACAKSANVAQAYGLLHPHMIHVHKKKTLH